MKLGKLQDKAAKLADYPRGQVKGLMPALWCAEEGVEVMRCFRVAFNKEEPLDEEHLKEEIGDNLIALVHLCNEMGYSMDEIAQDALGKQKTRQEEREEENE